VKTFAVAAPQFLGQRTVKEKKTKNVYHAEKKLAEISLPLPRHTYFQGNVFLFLVGYFVAFCRGEFLCVLRLKGMKALEGICTR
jgi:hypothetical protein